MGRISRIGP